AIFGTQKGFDSYLGVAPPGAVTGLYHPPTNRMVVYDFATNRDFVANRKRGDDFLRRARTDLERERLIVALGAHFRDQRDDTNVSRMMHEVAHQLSFNCGLLNRAGDTPAWLAEGLAVYCEATVQGSWQGIGEHNPQRARALAGPASGEGEFIPLRSLA